MNHPFSAPAQSRRRSIRVFVSSTFKDMQAEREMLVKQVFPALSKICAKRKVAWNEVDLRWGVPSEASAEDHVLPTCLAEIDNCRPFFIGLLGSRYGHIPDVQLSRALDLYPWLREVQGRSVTELEILHGVLNDPSRAQHAYFYLKDGESAATWDEEAGEQAADKLRDLKARIRESGFPVRGYTGLEALKRQIEQDFTALIDRLYPPDQIIEEWEQDAYEQESYALERSRVYVGREETFRLLDDVAQGDGPPLIVTSPSGSGKTSLLANWALRRMEAAGQAGQPSDVFLHFTGASSDSADWRVLVKRLIGELQRRGGLDMEVPEEDEALKLAFGECLGNTAHIGRIVVILDGLNQLMADQDGATPLSWLPDDMPSHVRLLVSTLPGDTLDELQGRGWETFEIEPLAPEERAALIRGYLSLYGKKLESLSSLIAGSPQTGNPLYLRILLDELRLHGDHETLEAKVRELLAADSIESLYSLILTRLDADYGQDRPDLVRDAMSYLWASRKGLTESDLRKLLGRDGEELPQAFWSPLYVVLESSLVNRSGYIGLFHDYLRNAVAARYFPADIERKAVHRRLADYFAAHPSWERRMEELPWQLVKAADWRRLYALLQEPSFWCALWERSPYELKQYWATLEDNTKSWRAKWHDGNLEELLLVDAFRPYLDAPDRCALPLLHNAAQLLLDRYPDEALVLLRELETGHAQQGDQLRLQEVKGSIADIHLLRTDLDAAMAYLREREAICRSCGSADGLYHARLKQVDIHLYRSEFETAMALLEDMERPGGSGRQPQLLFRKARILRMMHQWDEALALLEEHQRLCLESGSRFEYQESLGLQGNIVREQGDLEEARRLFARQEEICRSIGSLAGIQKALANQTQVAWLLGTDPGIIEELIRKQENLAQRLKSRDIEQQIIGQKVKYLGRKFSQVNQLKLLEEQEAICREIGSQQGLQECLNRKSAVLLEMKQLGPAKAAVTEAEGICRRFRLDEGLQFSLGNRSRILEAQGELGEALQAAIEQEQVCVRIGHRPGTWYSLERQAWLLLNIGRLDESLARFERLQQAEDVKKDRIALAYFGGGTALNKKGSFEEARAALLQAKALYEGLQYKNMLKKVLLQLEKLENKMQRRTGEEEEMLRQEEERMIREAIRYIGGALNPTFQDIYAGLREAWPEGLDEETKNARLASTLHLMRNRKLLLISDKKGGSDKRRYRLTPYGDSLYQDMTGDRDFAGRRETQRQRVLAFVQAASRFLGTDGEEAGAPGAEDAVPMRIATVGGSPAVVVFHGEAFSEREFHEALDRAAEAGSGLPLCLLSEKSYHLHQAALLHFYRWLKHRHASGEARSVALRLQSLERFETDPDTPWLEVRVRVQAGKLSLD